MPLLGEVIGSMRNKHYIALSLIVVSAVGTLHGCQAAPAATSKHESKLQAVNKSGEIRCSYLIYSPYFRKDPNTGELSGIFHDMMEEVGKASGLKIRWVEEVGYENIFPGLDANRYDVFAGGLWPNATRAKSGLFSDPAFYSVIKAWVRPDEQKIKNLDAVNDPSVKIATIDGAMEDIIASNDFPAAKKVSLPQQSPFNQNLLNVKTKKADITFAEPGIVSEFLASNPGSLRELAPDKPLRTFGNSLVVGIDQPELRDFLDAAVKELVQSGKIDQILKKYEPAPGVFPRVAVPYDPTTAVFKSR